MEFHVYDCKPCNETSKWLLATRNTTNDDYLMFKWKMTSWCVIYFASHEEFQTYAIIGDSIMGSLVNMLWVVRDWKCLNLNNFTSGGMRDTWVIDQFGYRLDLWAWLCQPQHLHSTKNSEQCLLNSKNGFYGYFNALLLSIFL